MSIEKVDISFFESELPLPDTVYRLGEKLEGISYREANPRALASAFSAQEEIDSAEVDRTVDGVLTVRLHPKVPAGMLICTGRSGTQTGTIPFDHEGLLFSASPGYVEYYAAVVPVIACVGLEASVSSGETVPREILRVAQMLMDIRDLDREVFSLISKVKYDNNSNQPYVSVLISISGTEFELQAVRNIRAAALAVGIRSAADLISKGVLPAFTSIAVYNNSAVFRL